MEGHQHWVKNVTNYCIIIMFFFVPNTSNSQITKGSYSEIQKKGLNYFSSSFNFIDKERFSYEFIGDTGLIRYGEGSYKINNNNLFLNFNTTKPHKEPYYKLEFYKTYRDSISIKILSKDFKGNIVSNVNITYKKSEESHSFEKEKDTILELKMFSKKNSDSSKFNTKVSTNENGEAVLKFKREDVYSMLSIFNRTVLKPIYIEINNMNNYTIDVFFNDKNKKGIPFRDVKWNYKIVEIKDNYIKLKDEKNREILWKKIKNK